MSHYILDMSENYFYRSWHTSLSEDISAYAMSKRKYTDQQFVDAVKNNFSIRGVLKTLGLAPAGGNYKLLHSRVKSLGLNTTHFTGQAHLKNKNHNWNIKIPLEEILINGSDYTTSRLRRRLISEGLFENKCSRCSISEWQGETISLHLDHINGDNSNNEITNLRLLCPNCHSQTPTYCRKK